MKKILLFGFVSIMLLGVLVACCYYSYIHRPHNLGTMQPILVIVSALAIAFVWVNKINKINKLNKLNPLKRIKPFNCITCLTGWVGLILAYLFNVPFYLVYFPIGVLTGAIFSRLEMKF